MDRLLYFLPIRGAKFIFIHILLIIKLSNLTKLVLQLIVDNRRRIVYQYGVTGVVHLKIDPVLLFTIIIRY